jgi:hypothetical protein
VDPNDKITANAGLMDGSGKSNRNSLKGKPGTGSLNRTPSLSKRRGSRISLEPGYGALHICARYNLKNLAIMLLLSDANPSLPSSPTGISPLSVALEADNLDMVKILLDLGAHSNVRDRIGRTPLHFAKTIEAAKLLVAYGARPELASDKFNKNADVRALKFVRKRYLEKTTGVGVEGDKVATNVEWIDDNSSDICLTCSSKFSFLKRKHHCRRCGVLTCNECSNHQFITYEASAPPPGAASLVNASGAAQSAPPPLPRDKSGDLLDAPNSVPDESPVIPVQARKSIMISPGRRNSKPDAVGGADAGYVAQRCCDGCYNYLSCASHYDFEDVLEGRQKAPEQKEDGDVDGDESKISSEAQAKNVSSNVSNEALVALQATLDNERKANKDLALRVESLQSSKSSLEEEVERLKQALAVAEKNSSHAKEIDSLKIELDSLANSHQELEKNSQIKDTIIKGLLEECAFLEQQAQDARTRASSTSSLPSPRGTQANYIKELEAQILDLKKVLSQSQKEQEDLWKATEGMERSSAAKKGSKGSSNFGSLKKKNITELESRIANLEFQLVYGQTKKDQMISKLQDRTKTLEKELKDALQRNVESWLFDSDETSVL